MLLVCIGGRGVRRIAIWAVGAGLGLVLLGQIFTRLNLEAASERVCSGVRDAFGSGAILNTADSPLLGITEPRI